MMEHALPVSLQDAVEGLADTVHAGRTREIRSLMIRLACMFNDEAVLLRIVDSAAANVLRRHTPPAYRAVSINQLAAERERVPALIIAARAVLDREPERQRQILRRDRLDRAWRPLADHVAALLPERHARTASLGMRLDHGLRIALGADRGRYLALAGRLLAGPSRLVEIARESLLPLADPPPGAGSRLGVLRPGELVAMQADARLVEAWRPGGGHRFAAQAARAAEHLMRIWLQARFADAQVHDLSICQVQGASGMPAAVAAALGRLGVGAAALEWPVALPADAAVLQDTTGAVSFYDAKNTVKSGHHLEIFVRGGKLNRPGVTFVAIWTDGWIRADQREALEALERPAGPTPHRASRDLNAVRLSVLGELDSASLAAFLRFRDQAAPRVGVGAPARVSDWAVEAGCMLPGLFFAYPEDAHAEGGAHRGEAMRTARLASRYLRTLPASILGALATGTRIEDPADPLEREVAAWFVARLRLRDPSRRAAPPALGEMYLLTLQIFLEFLECRKAGAGPDEDRLHRLPQLLLALMLPRRTPGLADFPLGAWDPSRSFRLLVRALDRLVATPSALAGLSRIDRIFISRRGTVVAAGSGGIRITLIARCESCGEAPLVRGQPVPGAPGLTNACDRCGRLLCSDLHGCPGGIDATPQDCLRRILEADPAGPRPARPRRDPLRTEAELRSIGLA